MRLFLALLLAAGALASRASAAPDPLAVLIAGLSAPVDETAADAPGASSENSPRLAAIQANLIAAAADYEALRGPSRGDAASEALVAGSDPALRPFLKGRDASLDAIYRTLAVVDYTWALRFPQPSCAAAERRKALLRSPDGLFVDPDLGLMSPWMARLLGPDSFGRTPEEALDQASAATGLTPSEYEKLRVRAAQLTEELSGDQSPQGSERAGLYCERAGLFERLARAHRLKRGPTLASLAVGDDGSGAAASVFLLAAPRGNDYDVLGAGFLVRTADGVEFVTNASIVRGQKTLYAFARPASEDTLGNPIPVTIERVSPVAGPAVGRIAGQPFYPALALADASPSVDELVRGVGPLRLAGPWTTTQGLVTGVDAATFRSDAVLSAEMAGSPVLNGRGEAAGLMIRRGDDVAALRPEELKKFLDGGPVEAADAQFVASRNTGSASLLTTALPVAANAWSAPGASAIETGLPSNLGGVNWEGGGGVGNWRPTVSAGPPSGYSPGYSSPYSSGGSASGSAALRAGGADLGTAIGNALGDLIVYGMRSLFRGVYSLFKSKPGDPRRQAVATEPPTASPPPPPPPPPEPKITGLTLSVDPADAAPGQRVTLIAQLQFQGDYKEKSGKLIVFTGGSDKAYFGTADNKQMSVTSPTDVNGRATAALTLEESVTLNSQNEFNDLDRERQRQDGQDTAPVADAPAARPDETPVRKTKDRAASEFDGLDEESAQPETGQESDEAAANPEPNAMAPIQAAAGTPAAALGAVPRPTIVQNLEAIHVAAAWDKLQDSKDIVPNVGLSPGQPPDCVEQLKKLYPQQQFAQQQRDAAFLILRPILAKYDIDYDQFQAVYPKLLFINDGAVCMVDVTACRLRSNTNDWSAAKGSYAQVQILDKKIQLVSGVVAQQQEACASLGNGNKKMRESDSKKSNESSGNESEMGPTASKLPNSENAAIDPAKFEKYSLDPNNPQNKGKAEAFKAIGYDVDTAAGRKAASDDIISQIRSALPNAEFANSKSSEYGPRFEVEIPITGPSGSGTLMTVWQMDNGALAPKLITNWLKVYR